jgi:hypothetical protein
MGAVGTLILFAVIGGLIAGGMVWHQNRSKAPGSSRSDDAGCNAVSEAGCNCLIVVSVVAVALYLVVRFIHWAWTNGLPSAS